MSRAPNPRREDGGYAPPVAVSPAAPPAAGEDAADDDERERIEAALDEACSELDDDDLRLVADIAQRLTVGPSHQSRNTA